MGLTTFGKVWRFGLAVLMGIGLAVYSATRYVTAPNFVGEWAIEYDPMPPAHRPFP